MPNATRSLLVILSQDAAGNLSGRSCPTGKLDASCAPVTGTVQPNGVADARLGGFPFLGTPATVRCANGASGLQMSGTFHGGELDGTYAVSRR